MARSGEYEAIVDGWRVAIRRAGEVLGGARWDGRQITGGPALGAPDVSARLYHELSRLLAAEIDASVAASPAAVDALGVDRALIAEALRLTPRERLLRLQDEVASALELLERSGHSAP